MVPRMEKLIEIHGRLGTDPEMIRKYGSYKNIIQRQLEMAPSNMLTMPLSTIFAISEHATKMTVYLATKAKEIISSNPEGRGQGAATASNKQTKKRMSPEEILGRKYSMESLMEPVSKQMQISDFIKIEPDLALLKYELDGLKEEGHGNFILDSKDDSVHVLTRVAGREYIFRLPADYPSTSTIQISTDKGNNFHAFVPPAIISPVTLTTLIRLVFCK